MFSGAKGIAPMLPGLNSMARSNYTEVRARTLFAFLFCLVWVPAFSQIYRAHHTPMDAVTLTSAQKKAMSKVDAKYGPRFDALVKKEHSGANESDSLDALNHDYTKALLRVMTSSQKLDYLHAVYAHMMDFLRDHPQMKMDEVFIWGGAYAVGPNVHHLPPGYPK
jgi:hypothetical protein